MSFIVRGIKEEDYEDLMALAKQFTLLNLPAEPKVLKAKIQRSLQSFAGKLEKDKTEFLFALEDLEEKRVIGTCLILAKHGTKKDPHYYFRIIEKKHQSASLGIGFLHNVLQFHEDTDGPTEIGGLMLDRAYRRRPIKLGRLLSLSRFIYMGLYPQKFEPIVLSELTPPLTEEGLSEFWEAIGRRFTGMTYAEADHLSHIHKDFVKNLFPEENIYVSLLESTARVSIGAVAEETIGAKHLLEKIGFKYKNEVDPFDGGPHYSCNLKDVTVVKNGSLRLLRDGDIKNGKDFLAGFDDGGKFKCTFISAIEDGDGLIVKPEPHLKSFIGKKVFCSPV